MSVAHLPVGQRKCILSVRYGSNSGVYTLYRMYDIRFCECMYIRLRRIDIRFFVGIDIRLRRIAIRLRRMSILLYDIRFSLIMLIRFSPMGKPPFRGGCLISLPYIFKKVKTYFTKDSIR